MTHVDVEQVRDVVVAGPELLAKADPRQDFARMTHEDLENRVLLRCQLDRCPGTTGFVPQQIEREISNGKWVRPCNA